MRIFRYFLICFAVLFVFSCKESPKSEEKFYWVSFINEYGENPDSFEVMENHVLEEYELPAIDEVDGYEFLGWYDEDTSENALGYTVICDVTFTARWKIIPTSDTSRKIGVKLSDGEVRKVYKLYTDEIDPDYATLKYNENHELYLGNPSKATCNSSYDKNYLLAKSKYTICYNNQSHNPNWVAWHLKAGDMGSVGRSDFYADTDLPDSYYKLDEKAYSGYTADGNGLTRGHMCPSGHRTLDSSTNKEVFTMANMVPQSYNNNGNVWGKLEDFEEQEAKSGKEVYIFCGPYGIGGTYANTTKFESSIYNHSNYVEYIPISGRSDRIVVPESTWRVTVILDEGKDDLSRIDENTTVIAVNIPNTYECFYTSSGAKKEWKDYITTVNEIEKLTGFDFLSNLDDELEEKLESKKYSK